MRRSAIPMLIGTLAAALVVFAIQAKTAHAAAQELYSTSFASDPNLVSYFRLEDAKDTENNKVMSNVNSTTFTSGKFNNAGTFVGGRQRSVGPNGPTTSAKRKC